MAFMLSYEYFGAGAAPGAASLLAAIKRFHSFHPWPGANASTGRAERGLHSFRTSGGWPAAGLSRIAHRAKNAGTRGQAVSSPSSDVSGPRAGQRAAATPSPLRPERGH